MSRRQPTRPEIRTQPCPECQASAGHPCVEVRRTGQHGKRVGEVRESVHQARLIAWQQK